jgi:hypothetical protein
MQVDNGRARAGVTGRAQGDVSLVASPRGGSRGGARPTRVMAGDARRRAIMALPAWRACAFRARVWRGRGLWWCLGQERGVEGGQGWARVREGEVVSITAQTREK